MLFYYTEVGYVISRFHGTLCAVAFAAVYVSALSSEAGVNSFSEELEKSLENTTPVKSNSLLVT